MTRAGAGGRRSAVAFATVGELRYFDQSVAIAIGVTGFVTGDGTGAGTAISVVVASTTAEGRLVPAMFNARAVNEYVRPDVNPFTTHVRAVVVQRNWVNGVTESRAAIAYDVIALPPFDSGAVHVTVAEEMVVAMMSIAGAPGTVGMTNVVVAAMDAPTVFDARTEIVREAPAVIPVTVHERDRRVCGEHEPDEVTMP